MWGVGCEVGFPLLCSCAPALQTHSPLDTTTWAVAERAQTPCVGCQDVMGQMWLGTHGVGAAAGRPAAALSLSFIANRILREK